MRIKPMSYKDLPNYEIAMDIYQKIMSAKTVNKYGTLFYNPEQDHININEIVEHLYFIKHTDKTPIADK